MQGGTTSRLALFCTGLIHATEDPENFPAVKNMKQPPCNLGICHLEGILGTDGLCTQGDGGRKGQLHFLEGEVLQSLTRIQRRAFLALNKKFPNCCNKNK